MRRGYNQCILHEQSCSGAGGCGHVSDGFHCTVLLDINYVDESFAADDVEAFADFIPEEIVGVSYRV